MAGIIEKFGITSGGTFPLKHYNTDDPGTMKKKDARGDLEDFQADLSEYQERLVCKVHPEYNLSERIPSYRSVENLDDKFWEDRNESIRQFEAHLNRNGTKIIKFFLHVSKEEQKERFLDRIEDKYKNWKFSASDIEERGYWDDYMAVYEAAIATTATEASPWYIIPADRKWFARYAVGKIIVETLATMEPEFPELPADQRYKLKTDKEKLQAESGC